MKEKIKVLIIESSALCRQTLKNIFSSDPLIEIIGTAADPYVAAGKMTTQVPDVITLDINTPRMNGLTFLKKIMSQHPIPVIIISDANKELTAKALEYGAIDVLPKNIFANPTISTEIKIKFCSSIKNAAKIKMAKKNIYEPLYVAPKLTADAILNPQKPKNLVSTTDKIIAVGASTGGIQAISAFLEALPADVPGILIVQHLPQNFTKSFAERLNETCKISVKEAEDGDIVKHGQALIAPGNYHLLLKKRGTQYYVQVKEGPLVNRHRPSVDVLFRSIALYAGKNSIGILLTGMGDDGAKGLLEMKQAGAKTIAQDEKSCVVFGMPKEAVMLNAADKILPLNAIADYVTRNIYSIGV